MTFPYQDKMEASSVSTNETTGKNEERERLKEMTEDMAEDFSKFLHFNVSKEEAGFNDAVEMMLTKLDEFFSLVDMIRSDTSLCLLTTVPDIQSKCKEMETVFEKIDKLEDFVNIVRECVLATEEKVNKAEADLSTVGGLMKKLTSLVSNKRKMPVQQPTRNKRTDYVPVPIFSTSQFFDHSLEAAVAESLNTSDNGGVTDSLMEAAGESV